MSRPSAAPAPLRAVRQRADVADVAPLALEAVECDLDIDEQMRRAAAKINQQFAQLDDAGTLCAMNYVYPLGNFARQLRIVPQASRFVAPAERLQGFALHMAPNAPVFALPFASLPMFNGLLAFPLPPARNLTLNFFANPQNRVLERLAAELSDADDLGAGDTGNFAGFYYDANALQFYVVVQCYSETLARETWQLIVAAEPQSLADVDAAMRASVAAANERRRREHLVDNYEVSIDVAAAKAAAAASAAASVSSASTKPRYTTVDELFLRSTRMQEIARASARAPPRRRAAPLFDVWPLAGRQRAPRIAAPDRGYVQLRRRRRSKRPQQRPRSALAARERQPNRRRRHDLLRDAAPFCCAERGKRSASRAATASSPPTPSSACQSTAAARRRSRRAPSLSRRATGAPTTVCARTTTTRGPTPPPISSLMPQTRDGASSRALSRRLRPRPRLHRDAARTGRRALAHAATALTSPNASDPLPRPPLPGAGRLLSCAYANESVALTRSSSASLQKLKKKIFLLRCKALNQRK